MRASAQLGEGPTWDHSSSTLLWVDILAPAGWDPVLTERIQDAMTHDGQPINAAAHAASP